MGLTQSQVRQNFIKANPGVKLPGYEGYWYKCACCGKWCGRPGSKGVTIPDDCKMEVDHILPWSKGGSDEVYNLQPLCKPCNRGKSANQSYKDDAKIIMNGVMHPTDALASIGRGMIRQNKTLKSLGLVKRK